MAKHRSKRYQKAVTLVETGKSYGLEEAVSTVKKFPAPKFDPTVTVSFHLGVDPRKSDQMVRGSVSLPHGTGKNVRVAVFAAGAAADAAKAAGAEFVGFEDLIKQVQGGFTDFDVAIATPEAMTEVRKIARVLGPRGLMPNPKTGTVTDDTAKAVNEVKAGRIDYKLDKTATSPEPSANPLSKPPLSSRTPRHSSTASSARSPLPPRATTSAASPSPPPCAPACRLIRPSTPRTEPARHESR